MCIYIHHHIYIVGDIWCSFECITFLILLFMLTILFLLVLVVNGPFEVSFDACYLSFSAYMVILLQAGREVKVYGHKRAKLNPHSSTTNRQKAKSKSFTMMRQKSSIKAKRKRSFRDRQVIMCGVYMYVDV